MCVTQLKWLRIIIKLQIFTSKRQSVYRKLESRKCAKKLPIEYKCIFYSCIYIYLLLIWSITIIIHFKLHKLFETFQIQLLWKSLFDWKYVITHNVNFTIFLILIEYEVIDEIDFCFRSMLTTIVERTYS